MDQRSFLKWHRRIALVFAPLLALQAVTGALLLFHEPLARLIDPAATLASPGTVAAPVSLLVQSAERHFPDHVVTRLFLPPESDATVFVQLEGVSGDQRYAALDPGSGKVLAAGGIWRFPMEAVLRLHYQLMLPGTGAWVILANGIALLLLGSSGLYTWWPGRKRLFKSFAIRRGLSSHLMLRQYHRSAGAAVGIVLLFSAATGLGLAISNLPSGAGAAGGPPVSRNLKASEIDGAVALARAQFPGARPRDIRFRADGRLDLNFFAPERNARAVHVVSVSALGPRVLRRVPADRSDASWMVFLPLHAGDSFGLAGKLLLMAGAAALLFLVFSGPLAWWRSRNSRKKKG